MTRRQKAEWDWRSHLFWSLVWTDAAVTAAWCGWFIGVSS